MAHYTSFKGLTPLLDRRKFDEPVVIDGRNFYVDADGPVSGFGSTYIAAYALTDAELIQDFKIGSTSFVFTRYGVLTYDYAAMAFVTVYSFATALTTVAPWSMAMVGGLYYFAREGSDLLQYTPGTNTWIAITGPNIPPDIRFVSAAGGRLAVLTPQWMSWSAIDDGSDFAPSTITGAGGQAIAIVGGGTPLGLLPIANGLLAYTTTGIMRSQLVQAVNPFRHDVLSSTHVPVSPYCVLTVSDNVNVFLTKNGLYSTDGARIQPWQPLMGEYLHKSVLPAFNMNELPQVIRLTYNYDKDMFFISVAETQIPSLYTRAFVLYIPTEQWGSFDSAHTGFISVNFSAGPQKGFNFGYVNYSGELHRFTAEGLRVTLPELVDNAAYYLYKAPITEITARRQLDAFYFPSIMRLRDVDERDMVESGVYDLFAALHDTLPLEAIAPTQVAAYIDAGVYAFSSVMHMNSGMQQIKATRVADVESALDAEIQLGPFFVGDVPQLPETMYIVTDMIIGMNAPTSAEINEDYEAYTDEVLLDFSTFVDETDEDYMAGGGVLYSDYSLNLQGSLDAYDTYAEEEAVPELEVEAGKIRKYSCMVNGMYHMLTIGAYAPGHSFHLKSFTINGFISGRV